MATTRPTIARRQLGTELRRLRTAAGRSQKEIAALIKYDVSAISRLERGERSLKPAELRTVLEFLGLSGEQRDEVLALGERARTRQRRRMYSDPLPGAFRRLGDLEAMATEIYYSSGELVPGMLQVESYSHSLIKIAMAAMARSASDDITARLDFRMERQELLSRELPPRMWFVVGEPALRRPVGGVDVLREQLRHLLVVIDRYSQVTVQVLPLLAVDHPLPDGTLTLLRFGDNGADMVHQGTVVGGGLYLDNESDVADCFRAYDRLRAVALGPAESREFIARRVEELAT